MAGKVRGIWEALAACFESNDQPLTMGQIIAWIGVHYPDNGLNPATLEVQIRRSCANVPFAQKYKAPKILVFDRKSHTYSRAVSTAIFSEDDAELHQRVEALVGDESLDSTEIEEESGLRAGLEAQLRDYLATNLSKLEKGLVFWTDLPPSVEYVIDGKRIDILAKDADGVPVVIELKRAKAYDKVVGQALLYQALIASKLKLDRVRVIVVANLISQELQLACSRQADFKLFEYEIALKLNPINSLTLDEEA